MREKDIRNKLKELCYRIEKVRGEENCYKLINFRIKAFCGYHTLEELEEMFFKEEMQE